jgi:hypothetical protein
MRIGYHPLLVGVILTQGASLVSRDAARRLERTGCQIAENNELPARLKNPPGFSQRALRIDQVGIDGVCDGVIARRRLLDPPCDLSARSPRPRTTVPVIANGVRHRKYRQGLEPSGGSFGVAPVRGYFGYPAAHEDDAERAVRALACGPRWGGRLDAGPRGDN